MIDFGEVKSNRPFLLGESVTTWTDFYHAIKDGF